MAVEKKFLDVIKDKEKKLEPLYKRMDSDLALYYLEKFVFKDTKNRKFPKASSLTLNDPKTYADRVVSILGNATRRFRIEGNITAQKEGEDFLNETFDVNDEVLALQQSESLEFHLNFYGSLRGWIAARAILYKAGKMVVPELVPLDPRWCSWQKGVRGLAWGCYRLMMSPERIKEEYGADKPSNKDLLVRVAFTKEKYHVWVGEDEIVSKPHKLGYCPIFVVPVPTHPSIIAGEGKTSIQYQGESIYSANRDIYNELNDLASVWATVNKMSFMTPLAFESPLGRELLKAPYGLGIVVNLKENEKIVEIPTKEITIAAQALFGQLDARIQRGGLPHIDYGELHFELSAVAISKLTESRNVVFVPRLDGKSTLITQIARVVVKQYKGEAWELDVKELTEDDPHIVFKGTLKHEMSIHVDYHSVSPEQNIANFTVAQVGQQLGLPKRYTFAEILQVKDPEGLLRLANREKAEEFIPELMFFRMASDLLKEAEENDDESLRVEAEIIANKLGMTIQGGVIKPGGETPVPTGEEKGGGLGVKLGAEMPATHHVVKEEARRIGVEETEKGRGAQEEAR